MGQGAHPSVQMFSLLEWITIPECALFGPMSWAAHVVLFGTFGIFALLGRTIVDRRKKRQMGGVENHARTGQRCNDCIVIWPKCIVQRSDLGLVLLSMRGTFGYTSG